MNSFYKKIMEILLVGFKGWGEESPEKILKKPLEQARVSDIEKLSMQDFLRLFSALKAPDPLLMNGEFAAWVLKTGPFYPLANWYTHNAFGPGKWRGKAFNADKYGKSIGYNIFSSKKAGEKKTFFRTRKMVTEIKASAFDLKPSFCLDYSPFNNFPVSTMRDEIRKVNDELFPGLGYMYSGGGPVNPAPFVLSGKIGPFVGADAEG